MTFSDLFRNEYRRTRMSIEVGDCAAVVTGCRNIATLCGKQYKLEGVSIQTKANLRYHANNFAVLANKIENDGIDNHVKAFLGYATAEAPKRVEIEKKTEPFVCNTTYESIDPVDFAICELTTIENFQSNAKPSCNDIPRKESADALADGEVVRNKISNASEDEASSLVFDPETLDSFIGQKAAVKRITLEISAARKLGRKYIDHALLLGSRGLGKTTLMKLVAKELGVRFEYIDCSQFRNDVASHRSVQSFFQRIGKANEPVVIGMDEIHALPHKLQTGLLTLLNDREFVYLDNSGSTHIVPIEHFTFIGATTEAQDVLVPLKDRCGLTFYLSDYSRAELRQIFRNKIASKELQINDDALNECINRCRSSVREVNTIVRGLETLAVIADTNTIDTVMVTEYFRNAGIDPIGLKLKDIEVLNILYEDDIGVMSEDTIATRAGIDAKVYNSEYESHLIKIGFMSISGKGRSLTEKARAYLKNGTYDFGELNATAKQANGHNVPEMNLENDDGYSEPIDELL